MIRTAHQIVPSPRPKDDREQDSLADYETMSARLPDSEGCMDVLADCGKHVEPVQASLVGLVAPECTRCRKTRDRRLEAIQGTPEGGLSTQGRLTWANVDYIRESGKSGAALAREFAVAQPTISRIRRGLTWDPKTRGRKRQGGNRDVGTS